jgi:D-alanyl-D-alanine carboxypeptidase/D-alanyl-D-alanine-endopeptidase (penicillin-binding protein 4)
MPTRDRGLVWFTIINRGTDVEGLRAGQDKLLQRLLEQLRVAPALPAALIPHPVSSNSGQLGASERNEILYRS